MTASPFLASIALFAGNFAIKDYLYCQGQPLAVSQNQALFSLLGNNYGGTYPTNFMLPNLSGAAVTQSTDVGPTAIPNTVPHYQTVGAATVTLTSAQMPAHTHAISSSATSGIGIAANSSAQATTPTPGTAEVFAAANQAGTSVTPVLVYAPATASPVALSVSGTVSGNGPSAVVGGGGAVSVMQPSMVLGYQICSVGYYPTRA